MRHAPSAPNEKSGLFDPGGVFWRVNRENVLALGAGRALLLQLAHPMVAGAVQQHSDFQKHPWRRLYRTARAMEKIVFGPVGEAREAVRGVQRVHHRVQGRLEDGRSYSARDPELVLWVYTTLVESALATYESFLPALTSEELESYYQGSRPFAYHFGIGDDVLPSNYAGFREYFGTMVGGPTLTVSDVGRQLADDVLHPAARPRPPRWALRWNEIITAGLLPAPIRERFGLPWDEDRERRWIRFRDRLQRWLPRLPMLVRAAPVAQWRELRLRSLMRHGTPVRSVVGQGRS